MLAVLFGVLVSSRNGQLLTLHTLTDLFLLPLCLSHTHTHIYNTNRTAKVKDGRDRWRVVYLAFSYSDGSGVEFGSYPQQHGAKVEQWFVKPEPGKICGMNG